MRPHKMEHLLSFFIVDLNGANQMDFSDFKQPKKESFCITQEMLDNCDISESVTLESISMPKLPRMEPESRKIQSQPIVTATKPLIESNENKNVETDSCKNARTEANPPNSVKNDRCEDTIFGELVAATLKSMNPEAKKQAKKDIMNILF